MRPLRALSNSVTLGPLASCDVPSESNSFHIGGVPILRSSSTLLSSLMSTASQLNGKKEQQLFVTQIAGVRQNLFHGFEQVGRHLRDGGLAVETDKILAGGVVLLAHVQRLGGADRRQGSFA